MSKPVRQALALGTDLSELSRARALVSQVATEGGFAQERCFDITVATSEATANAIEHSPAGSEVTVEVLLYRDRLEVHVEGRGEFELPAAAARENRHRGLGLPLMAKLSDHLALYSGAEGGTRLSLTFYRPGYAEAEASPRGGLEPDRASLAEDVRCLETFFDQSPFPLVLLDTGYNFIRVNEAYARACHRPVASFAGQNHFALYPSDTESLFDEVLLTKRPKSVAARAFAFADHPEWGVTYWDWTLTPLLDSAGEVEALLFSLREVEPDGKGRDARARRSLWSIRGQIFERRRALTVLPAMAIVQVALIFGIARLGGPREYLGLPGALAALVGVLAAVMAGPVVGALVAFVGGLAYFVFITNLGADVAWGAIVGSFLSWMLGAALAGFAGDWVRRQAANRETLLGQSLQERQELLESLHLRTDELAAAHVALEHSYVEQRSLAEDLQKGFLEMPPSVPGVDFGHEYRSATTGARVGGDFYDLLATPDGRLALVVGDVSGHGPEASRWATMVKDSVSLLVLQDKQPGSILSLANRFLVRRGLPGFVTAFLGVLDRNTGDLTYASAGHPTPLVSRADDGVTPLEFVGAAPLGVYPESCYAERRVSLRQDDLLLLYTDGLTDARANSHSFYGEEGLARSLEKHRALPAPELASTLVADALAFANGTFADDVALLVVKLQRLPAQE